jgi:predicted RNA-binding Zn-ribbon protein involved in translation (DUF1610 family)
MPETRPTFADEVASMLAEIPLVASGTLAARCVTCNREMTLHDQTETAVRFTCSTCPANVELRLQ